MEDNKIEDKKTLQFTLSNAIRYTNSEGVFVTTKDLTLYSPSNNEQPTARHLRQMIVNSDAKVQMGASVLASQMAGADKLFDKIKELQESEKNKAEAEQDAAAPITAEAILSLVYQQDSALLEMFFKKFKHLICTACCKCDDAMPLKASVYDQINYQDKDRLSGAYFALFLPPSF